MLDQQTSGGTSGLTIKDESEGTAEWTSNTSRQNTAELDPELGVDGGDTS